MKRRAETDKLEGKLLSLGRAVQSQFSKRGFFTILFGILFALYALFIIDYLTDIPYIIRVSLSVIGLIYAFYYLNKYFLRKARVQLSAEEVSLRVEEHNPALQSRLISMLQFQSVKRLPQGMSENLVEGMVDQAFDQVQDIRFTDIVDRSWVGTQFKRIGVILLFIAATAYLAPNYAMAFLQRFIDPSARYPTRTKILEVSVDDMIPAGDPFVIVVKAGGELPEIGNVNIETAEAGSVDFELSKTADEGVYKANIAAINEQAEMTIKLGDDTYGPQNVTPTPRPFLKSIKVSIDYPSYTGMEQKIEESGNIRAIKGSKLHFNIVASKPLEELNVSSKTKDFVTPAVQSEDGINWSMTLDAETSFSYQIGMLDKDGLKSSDEANYQVSVMRDRPPVIRIIGPKGSSEIASVSKLPLRFKVSDDIGINNVYVKYTIVQNTGSDEFQEIDYNNASNMMEFTAVNNKSFNFDDYWDNNKLTLRTGDTIHLWIEANDKSPEGHVQRSTDRQIMIISMQEYRNKLLQQLSDNVETVDEPIINLKDSVRKLGGE